MNTYDLGKLLKTTRQKNNLTQEQLATRLNVTPSAVSKWETGKNYPDPQVLLELSHLFNLSLEDMYHPTETIARLENDSVAQNTPFEENVDSPQTSCIVNATLPTPKRKGLSPKFWRFLSISIALIFLLMGLFVFASKGNVADVPLHIIQVAFRITEDEICGTVYEVACVYTGDIDGLSNTSPYMFTLADNWKHDTSVPLDITIMKVSFYPDEESALHWEEPYESIYFPR